MNATGYRLSWKLGEKNEENEIKSATQPAIAANFSSGHSQIKSLN